MRIERNLESKVIFETLKRGDVFEWKEDIFMKIFMAGNYNAVSLFTGNVIELSESTYVIPYPQAKVLI